MIRAAHIKSHGKDIREEEWVKHSQDLWYDKHAEKEELDEVNTKCLNHIPLEEPIQSLKESKNR